jgi:hypothetical protein
MEIEMFVRKLKKRSKMNKRERLALCDVHKRHRGSKRISKVKQEEYMKKMKKKYPNDFKQIWFENHWVKVRMPKMWLKHTTFRASQLIRHFKADEIRRAAKKLLKVKSKYNF